MACCKFHDQLAQKLTTHEYTAAACGSLKASKDHGASIHPPDGNGGYLVEGAPEYCCFSCPTLLKLHAAQAQATIAPGEPVEG